jgi:hypothetical protein
MSMKLALQFLALSLLFAPFTVARAADELDKSPELRAVTAADNARVAAFKKPTGEKLGEIFSDELHYAHSSGVVDTKASFIQVLTSGKTRYLGIDYEQRDFTFPLPGIALMTGRARIQAETAGSQMDSVLSFLAVWRLENGQWRFLAWQSCKLPPPAKP